MHIKISLEKSTQCIMHALSHIKKSINALIAHLAQKIFSKISYVCSLSLKGRVQNHPPYPFTKIIQDITAYTSALTQQKDRVFAKQADFAELSSEEKKLIYKERKALFTHNRDLIESLNSLMTNYSMLHEDKLLLKQILGQLNKSTKHLKDFLNALHTKDLRWQLYQLVDTDDYLKKHKKAADLDDCVQAFIEDKSYAFDENIGRFLPPELQTEEASTEAKIRCALIHRGLIIETLSQQTGLLRNVDPKDHIAHLKDFFSQLDSIEHVKHPLTEAIDRQMNQEKISALSAVLNQFDTFFKPHEEASFFTHPFLPHNMFKYTSLVSEILNKYLELIEIKDNQDYPGDLTSVQRLTYRCACSNPMGKTYEFQTSRIPAQISREDLGGAVKFLHRPTLKETLEKLLISYRAK
jgi:hypothetical protein